MDNTLYIVAFKKNYKSYTPLERAAFPLADAIQLVDQGFADFTNPDDLVANQEAVTAATPTPLIAVQTYIQTTNDGGSEPQVVMRRRGNP